MYYGETHLDFLELGIVPQSSRNLGQTITPDTPVAQRRLANGDLKDRSRPSLRKYRSTITFGDTYPPAFDGLWSGAILTTHNAAELSGDAGKPFSRPHVPGSVIWRDANGDIVPSGADEAVAPQGATNYTYRPIIVWMVGEWDIDHDEWGAMVSATLNLREV